MNTAKNEKLLYPPIPFLRKIHTEFGIHSSNLFKNEYTNSQIKTYKNYLMLYITIEKLLGFDLKQILSPNCQANMWVPTSSPGFLVSGYYFH